MNRGNRLLPVLLATIAVLFAHPGAAGAEPARPASDEQIVAAVERLKTKQHSPADVALVKTRPEIARYVPDPNGPSITVGKRGHRAPGTLAAGRNADRAAVAAAETCGHSYLDVVQLSILGGTIYKWRHHLTWCDDRVTVTRILARFDQVLQIDPFATIGDLRGDRAPTTGVRFTHSYYMRHIQWCAAVVVGCYNMYPWSEIHIAYHGGWTFRFGDAGW
jgi:hypothetical protein